MKHYHRRHNNRKPRKTYHPRRQQTIVGKTTEDGPAKSGFIAVNSVSRDKTVVQTPFTIKDGVSQPNLFLHVGDPNQNPKKMNAIQGIIRDLAKMIPSVMMYSFDGSHFQIDLVRRQMHFHQDVSGLLQFIILKREDGECDTQITSIFHRTKKAPITFEAPEKTDFNCYGLKIFTSYMDNPKATNAPFISIATCMVDRFEKILFLPIIDKKTGLIGTKTVSRDRNQRSLFAEPTIRSIWPELEIDLTVHDGECTVKSNFVKNNLGNDPEIEDGSILYIHKNVDSTEMLIDPQLEMIINS